VFERERERGGADYSFENFGVGGDWNWLNGPPLPLPLYFLLYLSSRTPLRVEREKTTDKKRGAALYLRSRMSNASEKDFRR